MTALITYIVSIVLAILAFIPFRKNKYIILALISTIAFFTVILFVVIDQNEICSDLCRSFKICCNNDYEVEGDCLVESALNYINSGEYDLAEKEVNKISEYYSKTDKVNAIKRQIFDGKKQQYLTTINGYLNEKKYLETINYIDGLNEDYKNISEIIQKREEALVQYKNIIFSEADNLFKTSGYQKAIEHLQSTLNLFPEDEDIKNKINEYSTYKPVPLSSIEPYYSNTKGYGKGYYESDEGKDNTGNEYVDVIGGNWENKYKIDGKYHLITGVLYYRYEYKNISSDKLFNTTGKISIYNDDKILASYTIRPGDQPIKFTINISQVNNLKIVSETSDMTLNGNICYAELANVSLSK